MRFCLHLKHHLKSWRNHCQVQKRWLLDTSNRVRLAPCDLTFNGSRKDAHIKLYVHVERRPGFDQRSSCDGSCDVPSVICYSEAGGLAPRVYMYLLTSSPMARTATARLVRVLDIWALALESVHGIFCILLFNISKRCNIHSMECIFRAVSRHFRPSRFFQDLIFFKTLNFNVTQRNKEWCIFFIKVQLSNDEDSE